jgi:hypothetical protein
MKGISAGDCGIRVEMYEPWSSGEKQNFSYKEITAQYTSQTSEDRSVKIPTVKSVQCTGLTFVSSAARNIYHEKERNLRKESTSRKEGL